MAQEGIALLLVLVDVMCRYGKTAVQAAKIPSLSTDAGSQRQSPVSQSLLVALCTFPCFYTSTLHTLTLKFTGCLTRQQLRQLLDMLQGRSANFSTALSKIQVHSYYVDDLHVALSLTRLTTTAVHALYQDTIRTLRAPAQMHDVPQTLTRGGVGINFRILVPFYCPTAVPPSAPSPRQFRS